MDFGPVVAFNYLPVEDVLDSDEEVVGKDTNFSRAMVGIESEVQLEVVGNREGFPAVSDVAQSGVMVRFNPPGVASLYFAPYGLV